MLGLPLLFTNAVVTAGTAANPTAIRCEAQYYDGKYVKCAVVEFSDGEGGDGVYAQLVGAFYKTTTELGMRFVKDDGTKVDDSNVNAGRALRVVYSVHGRCVRRRCRGVRFHQTGCRRGRP